jgi:hypothetical protein
VAPVAEPAPERVPPVAVQPAETMVAAAVVAVVAVAMAAVVAGTAELTSPPSSSALSRSTE